jgi:hypothetical protein
VHRSAIIYEQESIPIIMTSSERKIFVDQENLAPEGAAARGLLAPKRGKMALKSETAAVIRPAVKMAHTSEPAAVIRPVLGEISQNIALRNSSQQLLRPPKQQVR